MKADKYDSLSLAMNSLTKEGYTDDFKAKEASIIALYSKKEFQPDDLKIVKSFRFEGMSNPADSSLLLAIVANDGTKGTLVMSYSAEHAQNEALIQKILYE